MLQLKTSLCLLCILFLNQLTFMQSYIITIALWLKALL